MRLRQQTHWRDDSGLRDYNWLVSVSAIAILLSACSSGKGDTTSKESGVVTADAAEGVPDVRRSDFRPDALDLDANFGSENDSWGPLADEDSGDLGATQTGDDAVVEAKDATVGDPDSAVSIDAQLPDVQDVHIVVKDPSSGLGCNCWPDGDDCDAFWDMVNWRITDLPPCPEGEVCTGDYYNRGECLASCWHPDLPDQNVGVQCDPSEYCFLRKLYNWEFLVVGKYAVCYPKQ